LAGKYLNLTRGEFAHPFPLRSSLRNEIRDRHSRLDTRQSTNYLETMSGRLTILPKKTYCPWKPENVERVLRDERLERERQQAALARSLGDEDDARRRRRRYDEGGHINLFPEAKDAELRLISGGRGNENKSKSSSSAAEVLPPAPLGGDEAARRKSGDVPFYMRQSSDGGRRKYDNTHGTAFRLGDNRASGVRADEITGKIMKDQFARREDDRKDKMDPMSRFYVDCPGPSHNTSSGITANASAPPTRESNDNVSYNNQSECNKKGNEIVGRHHEHSRDERRTRRNHKSNRKRRRDDSSVESASASSSSSGSSSVDNARRRKRKHSSERHSKRDKSRSSHREECSDDERHSRRKRSSKRESGDKSRRHRHRQRHEQPFH
jgi:hypothetical protein